MSILTGTQGLLTSRKASLCLIILAVSSTALFLGKLDSMSFAAIVSSVVLIYNYCQHAVDLASQPNSNGVTQVIESARNSIQK